MATTTLIVLAAAWLAETSSSSATCVLGVVPRPALSSRARRQTLAAVPVPAEPPSAQAVLLRVEFAPAAEADGVRSWLTAFAFAAALPVQPLSVASTAAGCSVTWRRKPRSEGGTDDGGVDFEVGRGPDGGVTLVARRRLGVGSIAKSISEKLVCNKLLASAAAGDAGLGVASFAWAPPES